jgi:FkbM family methyltransferase
VNSTRVVLATARLTGFLFRNAFPLYAALYDRYKRATERGEIALIRRLARPGTSAVDIGANIGFYTRVLAQCVGTEGRVYAFEPDALNFRRLCARTQPYPQAETVHAAVTEASGKVDLYISRNLSVDHRTYATEETRRKVVVDAIALDDFFRGRSTAIRFIKMDIQGAEYAALLGMRGVVERSASLNILMEMWPEVLDRFGPGTNAVLELLESWGFQVRIVTGDGSVGQALKSGSPLPNGGRLGAYFPVLCARHEVRSEK